MPKPFALWILTLLVVASVTQADERKPADDAARIDFFESRIRPVLVKHCYECHAVDSQEIKGGLVVDSAAGLLDGGDSGPALVKHQPAASPLLDALRYDGLEMPPAGKLPDNVIQDFERWIAMGAPDPRVRTSTAPRAATIDIEQGRQFWAFQRPQRHPAPQVKDQRWPRTSIDAFVLAQLEASDLQPVADADRGTLVRRIYYDLTGLPPSPAAFEAAINDLSVEALVDQLLDSPQFGVHWGRHWLDVARYADSNGSDFNATFHNAWRYRDYVVDAMNHDKPFDQFVREQLAGDLLPFDSDEQRAEQIIATGFLILGTKMLSERDKAKLQMDVVDEQINTVGSAFMGMTLGCARCHDHKFDPIPTRDYYALAGIFSSSRTLQGESQKYVSTWKRSDLPAEPALVAAVGQHEQRVREVAKRLADAKKQLQAAENHLNQLGAQANPLLVDDTAAKLVGRWKASTLVPSFIGKGYIHDDKEGKGQKSVSFELELPQTAAYEIRLSYTSGSSREKQVPVTIQHADGEASLTVDQTREPPIDGLFASLGRFRFSAGKPASVTITTAGTTGHVIVDAVQFVELDAEGQPVDATPPDTSQATRHARQEVDRVKTVIADLENQTKELNKQAPPPLPQAIAVAELDTIDDCEICVRGEHLNRGEKVPRGFLQVATVGPAPEIPSTQSGRRELADWIANPAHPLTGRVMVNRVWYHLLGEGLVRSVDNFGELGQRPTHPELLDELASRFVAPSREGGFAWSVKQLIREIMLSRTYQLSSASNEHAWNVDAENRLLWRAHRRRLPAEAIRDSMLFIGGVLDVSPGGSPVKGLGTLVNNNTPDAESYESQETARRSLYLPIIRNELPASLTVFDFADPDLVVGRRPVTNVPAQALLLMNSPFVMKSAELTSELLLQDAPRNAAELVANTYRRVLARQPTPDEVERAIAYLQPQQDGLATAEQAPLPTATQLSRFVHVLFASTEFRMLN